MRLYIDNGVKEKSLGFSLIMPYGHSGDSIRIRDTNNYVIAELVLRDGRVFLKLWEELDSNNYHTAGLDSHILVEGE